ncbi:MAG TPA: phosphodiester glycosidase family protein [Gaiellales bacterium]|nr:phosphodiester glycosidase family protein [Gaiellales bacterium]
MGKHVRVAALVGLAMLVACAMATPAFATRPRLRGPIKSYSCAPPPYWCTKTLKRGRGGWPGITIQHLRLHMRRGDGPTQNLYRVRWRLGDPHVHLSAAALGAIARGGAIHPHSISHWVAAGGAPAGFAAALNGDFFDTLSGVPNGVLVHKRHVLELGAEEPAVGFHGGSMIMGTTRIAPVKLLLPGGQTATVGAFIQPTQALGPQLADLAGDQVAVVDRRTAPVTVPAGYLGFVVGDESTATPFPGMLTGSAQLTNGSGGHHRETMVAFRFRDTTAADRTLVLPFTPGACTGGVCEPGKAVTLAAGESLLIARSGSARIAATGLQALAGQSSPAVPVTLDDAGWGSVTDAIGGKPQLVRDGVVTYPRPWFNPPMMSSDGWQWEHQHYRPAVVQTRTGNGWLAITGGPYEVGVYGWTWGRMLQQLGAENAMGFDNNSSTEIFTLSAGRHTYWHGYQRAIVDATAVSYR